MTTFLGDHISYVATQVSKGIEILAKLKFTLPLNELRLIYLNLILPSSNTAGLSGQVRKSLFLTIVNSSEKGVRNMTCSTPQDPTSSLFASLNLLKLPDFITQSLTIFSYRCLNNLLPTSFSSLYTVKSHVHS